ncbi:unnamed protein product [Vitrella brassicaformis CCMP3155]|uniref:Uncharacterized protein n=1 Tax=Vitrella brassicaformis (strain CCMP3155) TaxID=1169540 RepID=A0A0G4H1Z3_VITBC|nr:unnamed protein product [Vitrella brassicaformis CCMP3155]|eukprot:CEM37422.1 unnamed protein product [Vitrella brassicaformis CCMP3155]
MIGQVVVTWLSMVIVDCCNRGASTGTTEQPAANEATQAGQLPDDTPDDTPNFRTPRSSTPPAGEYVEIDVATYLVWLGRDEVQAFSMAPPDEALCENKEINCKTLNKLAEMVRQDRGEVEALSVSFQLAANKSSSKEGGRRPSPFEGVRAKVLLGSGSPNAFNLHLLTEKHLGKRRVRVRGLQKTIDVLEGT